MRPIYTQTTLDGSLVERVQTDYTTFGQVLLLVREVRLGYTDTKLLARDWQLPNVKNSTEMIWLGCKKLM